VLPPTSYVKRGSAEIYPADLSSLSAGAVVERVMASDRRPLALLAAVRLPKISSVQFKRHVRTR
jgi:hypothetical protein